DRALAGGGGAPVLAAHRHGPRQTPAPDHRARARRLGRGGPLRAAELCQALRRRTRRPGRSAPDPRRGAYGRARRARGLRRGRAGIRRVVKSHAALSGDAMSRVWPTSTVTTIPKGGTARVVRRLSILDPRVERAPQPRLLAAQVHVLAAVHLDEAGLGALRLAHVR